MKNKGFTLIELLAVIVILAIISAITVPIIIGIIDKIRIASYKESVRSIFEATNIYIASENFEKFPNEGINVTNPLLKISNKNFTSGKVILNEQGKLEVDKVSDGRYCAGGTNDEIVVIKGSCDQLDVTPPTVSLTSNLVTSNSITIVATGEDLESGINGYEFSKDNGTTWTSKQTSNVYTFNNLTNDTDYIFKVRVINNNQLFTISNNLTVRTNDIPIPTYSINTTDWVSSVIVTIMYPVREEGYVYQYSLDNALTWLTVETPTTTKDITFNDNGNVIARILDGTNEISGTAYTVANIDKINPTVEITVAGSPFNANGWANTNFNLNIQGVDNESGVKSYIYCQTTSASCTPTTVVNAVSGTVTISTESTTNKVCAQSTDNGNNNSFVVCSSTYKLDKTNPTVTFGTNGNSTYARTRSTIVTVNDTSSGVLASGLKYQWTTSTTTPTEVSFTTAFTSGGTISTPAGVTGGYYLWILGKDNAGNTMISRSNVFNLDNTAPVITVNPQTVTINKGTIYTDIGVTATDNIDGSITVNIVKTGTVNPAATGSYTLTYNVNDSSGNVATQKTRTVTVVDYVYTYAYTGNYQTFTAPIAGIYQIELWGATSEVYRDSESSWSRTNGNYVKGDISLNQGQILYIYAGGKGTEATSSSTNNGAGWNGGGSGRMGTYGGYQIGRGGGGATDIRLVSGVWNDFNSLKSRIMVAGGAGAESPGNVLNISNAITCSKNRYGSPKFDVLGATQVRGGKAATGASSFTGQAGGFGNGGNGEGYNYDYGSNGGGGGYYGGSGGWSTDWFPYPDYTGERYCAGSGTYGSSFISGYTGCDAISASSTSTNIIHTGQPNHYSGLIFTNVTTNLAVNSGNGQAKITFISQ